MRNLYDATVVDEVHERIGESALLPRMTPVEWSTFLYVHLDHHLRQFAV